MLEIFRATLAVALLATCADRAYGQNDAPEKAGPFFAQPDYFTYGYVAGVAGTLMDFAPDTHAQDVPLKYRKCLVGQTPISMTKVVKSYVGRHPESNTYSPDMAVVFALQEMCSTYLKS